MSPIYAYTCPNCNAQVDKFRSAENRRMAVECAECGTTMNLVTAPQDSVKPGGRVDTRDVFRKV